MSLPIGLSQFCDFATTPGAGRIRLAREMRDGQRFDFYKSARETIAALHSAERAEPDVRAAAEPHFAAAVAALADPKEQRIYPDLFKAYRKFLRGSSVGHWFEPPMRDYPVAGVTVRVAPELGIFLNGQAHAIKLYLRGEPMGATRILMMTSLLSITFSATWPSLTVAVLDVRRAKLHLLKPGPNGRILVRAEAAALAEMWSLL